MNHDIFIQWNHTLQLKRLYYWYIMTTPWNLKNMEGKKPDIKEYILGDFYVTI